MADDKDPHEDVNTKLIRTKEQWAKDGRALTGTSTDPRVNRRPPGQRITQDFPVLDLGIQPKSGVCRLGEWLRIP